MFTRHGTKIDRYLGLVGKLVGDQVYVHKNYTHHIFPIGTLTDSILKSHGFSKYNCIMWNKKTNAIRFDEAPDFDTAREPHVGKYLYTYGGTCVTRIGYSNAIWHHKWLWVMDDYAGFNVAESKHWSEKWLSKIPEIAKGTDKTFNEQLRKYHVENI